VVELHTSAMALYESETPRVVDKFNGDNFSLFKFKMEMILDEKDLWDIVEETEKAPSIESDEKVISAFKKRERVAFRILCTHMVDAQIQHVKSCARGLRKHGRLFVAFMRPRAWPMCWS
jgi:hypothetical protein